MAMRPVIGPASLVNFEAMTEGNIVSARKFDDGKITTEQYIAEIRAQWEEFAVPGTAARRHNPVPTDAE
jgi:hypothetical protein